MAKSSPNITSRYGTINQLQELLASLDQRRHMSQSLRHQIAPIDSALQRTGFPNGLMADMGFGNTFFPYRPISIMQII
jgi:hypothetical protein